ALRARRSCAAGAAVRPTGKQLAFAAAAYMHISVSPSANRHQLPLAGFLTFSCLFLSRFYAGLAAPLCRDDFCMKKIKKASSVKYIAQNAKPVAENATFSGLDIKHNVSNRGKSEKG
ncbi:MAG: hypothetical protein IJB22_05895, partial [Clostridia bacterium]|nr:hypothetical protein [Clostridia bacterium]